MLLFLLLMLVLNLVLGLVLVLVLRDFHSHHPTRHSVPGAAPVS